MWRQKVERLPNSYAPTALMNANQFEYAPYYTPLMQQVDFKKV
jgi:hypothetical protein